MSINQNSDMAKVNKINAVAKEMKEKQRNAVDQAADYKLASTFEKRESKKTPVQSALDKHLDRAMGKYYVITGAEYQETPDYDNPDKINTSTVYSVRVISSAAWIKKGMELEIKVKNHKPIFNDAELYDIMFGSSAPVVVSFDGLSHYCYGKGETLNAENVHKVNITLKEAMDYE